jgi:hypothetical protein
VISNGIVNPQPIVVPYEMEYLAMDRLREGLVEIQVKMKVDRKKYCCRAHFLFGAELREDGAELLKY